MISNYRIYYEDTDSGGVVYHANYLKFAERARSDMLRDFGINQSELSQNGELFIVKSSEIDFIKAAKLDDLIEVHTSIVSIGASYIDFLQEIKINDDDICKIKSKIVFVNRKESKIVPKRIPEYIRILINNVK